MQLFADVGGFSSFANLLRIDVTLVAGVASNGVFMYICLYGVHHGRFIQQ